MTSQDKLAYAQERGLFDQASRIVRSFGLSGVSLSLFLLGVAWLVSLPARAQSDDTKIKIHGGASTFFSEYGWTELPGRNKNRVFCAPVTRTDLQTIKLKNFFEADKITAFRSGRRTEIPFILKGTWQIELLGHEARAEGKFFARSTNGVLISASSDRCPVSDAKLPPSYTSSVELTPLGGGDFYPPPDLIQAEPYRGNKRFAVPSCSPDDRDRCERIAQVTIKQPGQKDRVFSCPDGACTVFIGDRILKRVLPSVNK